MNGIGKRIKYLRKKQGLTQRQLGEALGFNAPDARITQYELGRRTPKDNVVKKMAHIFNVNPHAIALDIDSPIGLLHTLFMLEDTSGFTISTKDGMPCLLINQSAGELYPMLQAWHKQSVKLNAGEISRGEYNHWRYNYSLETADSALDTFKIKVTAKTYETFRWRCSRNAVCSST